jgi:hypothetical protein
MEELVRRGPDWRTVGSREENTQEPPLPDSCFPTDLQNLMPHLDVCDPSDYRVAFISRGQPHEVTSVASDANAVRWWHCRHWLVTNRQSMSIINADLCALYYRLDLREPGDKVAWIERPSHYVKLLALEDLARASTTRVELAICGV